MKKSCNNSCSNCGNSNAGTRVFFDNNVCNLFSTYTVAARNAFCKNNKYWKPWKKTKKNN